MSKSYKTFAKRLGEFSNGQCAAVPSMAETHEFTDFLIKTLFPIKESGPYDPEYLAMELERCSIKLRELFHSISRALDQSPEELTAQFSQGLPEVFEQLVNDAESIIRFDPASSCVEEVILSYPGFYCISVYRLANVLYRLGVPVMPRMMTEYAHGKTGIDIHPGAEIGSPFFIDHGTGIVIGETTRIGEHVKIYQGVTLGALSVEKKLAKTKRHPNIEDHVVIYAGSTILGGETTIGHHTVVGGNTWITESVLPYSVVYRNHRVVIRDSKDYDAPYDFVI